MPDGVVIGRKDLQEVAAAAEAAVREVLQAAPAPLAAAQQWHNQQPAVAAPPDGNLMQPAASPAAAEVDDSSNQTLDGEDALPVVSLNTVAERGIAVEVCLSQHAGPPGCCWLAIQSSDGFLCVKSTCHWC